MHQSATFHTPRERGKKSATGFTAATAQRASHPPGRAMKITVAYRSKRDVLTLEPNTTVYRLKQVCQQKSALACARTRAPICPPTHALHVPLQPGCIPTARRLRRRRLTLPAPSASLTSPSPWPTMALRTAISCARFACAPSFATLRPGVRTAFLECFCPVRVP